MSVKTININIEVHVVKLKSQEGEIQIPSFSVELSESVPYSCVVGPSGSGKTTFFKSLIPRFVDEWKEYAEIEVDIELTRNGLDFFGTNGRVGYAAQKPFFVAHRTVRDNLLEPFRWCSRQAPPTNRVDQVIEDFALSKIVDRRAYQLSAGERQRLNLARMFIADPELVMIDECFSPMEEGLAQKIARVIVDKYAKDTRILVTGHRKHDLVPFFPKVLEFSFTDETSHGPVRKVSVTSRDETITA